MLSSPIRRVSEGSIYVKSIFSGFCGSELTHFFVNCMSETANKRLAKNTIFLSVRMVIVLAISLYTTRVILQILGVVDYGVYNVVCGFVTMFGFLNTSMSNGIQRFFNYEYGKNGEDGANEVYCTSLLIQSLLAVIVIILVEAFGLWYLHNKMVIPASRSMAAEWIFQLAILMFVVGIMQAPFSAAVIAHEKLDFYAVISIIDAILKLGIVFLLKVFPTDKLIVYGILSLFVTLLNLLLYFVYCKLRFKEIKLKRGVNRMLFKSMLGFSGWNVFGSFSNVMENQGINLVMNFFFGPIVNAARGVASQINGGVQSFVQNITMPVRPQVTQSYARGEVQRTMSLTYGVSKLSCAIILMLAIPASIEINYLLRLWLGDSVPDHTAMFTILILLTSLVNNLNAAISNVVHATGIMRDYQLWASIVRISSVPIAFVLIKYFDVPELGLVAVLFTAVATHTVCLCIVSKLIGVSIFDYNVKVILPIVAVLIISIVVVAPIHFFLSEGFIRFIIICFVSVISVGLSLFYIAFNKGERQLTVRTLKPFLIRTNKE